jgi:hypothetical protein
MWLELEQELMAEINESMSRKDKYMTPSLQNKNQKMVNKLNAAAYSQNTKQVTQNSNNSGFYQERHNSKNRITQL